MCFLISSLIIGPFFEVNGLNNPNFFICIIALVCLITVVIPKKLFRAPLFLGIILLSFCYYFPSNTQSYGEWRWPILQSLLSELAGYSLWNLFYIPERMAFLILLTLIILLSGLLIDYNNWFVPYLIAVGYLLVLEVYMNVDVFLKVIIMTTVIFSFILLIKEDKQKLDFVIKGLLVLMLCLGLATNYPTVFEGTHNKLVSISMPIRSHIHSQGFYNRFQQSGLRIARRSGFSDNDRNLGGPLTLNNELVFTAYQETGHYWRVETKNIYTGDGWDDHHRENLNGIEELPYEITSALHYRNGEERRSEAVIELEANATFIPLPYGRVLLSSGIENQQMGSNSLSYDSSNNRLLLTQRGSSPMNQFQIQSTWSQPTPEELRDVLLSDLDNLAEYLQLPSTLPDRVSDLALELTADAISLYDQVMAIQSFLSEGHFRYSVIDASFTPEGRDYVDYFLFDTRVGYCDNFSTSMVVLLRTLGIPTRWAKGFTQGNRVELTDSDYNQYTVLNSHAHSWVEVFFPGIGWIPFEPTPSYTLSNESDEIEEAEAPELEEDQEIDPLTEDPVEEAPLSETDEETSTSSSTESDTDMHTSFNWYSVIVNLVMILIAVIGVVLTVYIYKNFHWLGFMLYMMVWARDFEGTYRRLLKVYGAFEVRLPKEPLTEYAKRVSKKSLAPLDSFIVLTERYEESLYGDKIINFEDYKPLFREVADAMYKKMK